MKYSTYIILLLIAFSVELFGQTTEQNELIITITNIKKVTGRIQIGIYNEESDFPSIDGQYRVVFEDVKSDQVVSVIENLPKGNYGIAIYQDENGDGVCNKNFIGIPKEPYGFSTNFKPRFKAPTFDNVKFSFPSESSITIELLH